MPARLSTLTVGMPLPGPECHDRDAGALEVLDEFGSVAQVAQEKDRIAVAGLQDAPQRHGFVRALVGVAQDDVVAAPIGLQRSGLDGAGEEGVRDVANDDAQQHRGRPPQAAGQRIGTITHALGRLRDALSGGLRDGHGGGCPGEDA